MTVDKLLGRPAIRYIYIQAAAWKHGPTTSVRDRGGIGKEAKTQFP